MLTKVEQHEILCKYQRGERVQYLANQYKTTAYQIRKSLGSNYLSRGARKLDSRQKQCNDSYFESIDSEQKAYWLGMLATDGCLYTSKYQHFVQIELQEKDRYILEAFQKDTSSTFMLSEVERFRKIIGQSTVKCYRSVKIAINSRQWIYDLKKHGLSERKSLTLQWPTNISDKLLRHFIRGVLDGDGCLRIRNNRYVDISFSSGSEEFIKSLKYHLDRLSKENGNLHFEENGYNGRWKLEYYIGVNADKKQKFSDLLYKEATRFLTRKREILENSIKYER